MNELKIMQKRAAKAGFSLHSSKNDSPVYLVATAEGQAVGVAEDLATFGAFLAELAKQDGNIAQAAISLSAPPNLLLMEKRAAAHDLTIQKGDDGYSLLNTQGMEVGSAKFLFGLDLVLSSFFEKPSATIEQNMKPEDFWKNITDEQFDAAVKKFGFSESDLHDIRKARFIICQLAHGDSPFERSTVDVTCDNERCVSPKHLKWAPIRSIDAVVADLDALTEATENASNLDELLETLQAFESVLADALETYKPDALTPRRSKEVPTFGGQRPADDVGVISWDEHRLLVSNGSGWEIIDRAKWQGLPPEARPMVEGWTERGARLLPPRSVCTVAASQHQAFKHSSIQAFKPSNGRAGPRR